MRALPHDGKGLLKLVLVGIWVLLMSQAPADPDLWGHVRFGQDLLAVGRIAVVDPYSFTSDRIWINHEWLSEILMAGAFSTAGVVGLNLLRLAVVGATLWLVWRRSAIVLPSARFTLVVLAALGTTFRALPIRPQLFSLVCFAALLSVLTQTDEDRRHWRLAAIPPIFALWVNLHGGWIVGLGTLAMWTALCLATRRDVRWWALPATTVAAALSTLANPYGVGMWRFLYSTVGLNRPMIGDWLPLYAMPPGFWLGWLVAAGLCMAAARRPDRVPRGDLALTAVLGLLAIRVSRIDAFFCLAAVFLLARALPDVERAAAAPRMRSRLIEAGALLAVCAVALASAFHLRRVHIHEALMPEQEAVSYVIDHRLNGRFLTWFDWGEFAIWHLADRSVLVSMDGRRETVYTDRVVNDHLRFYFAEGSDGAIEYPRKIRADYVWLPVRLPVVRALEARGWKAAFKGPVSVILEPPGHEAAAPVRVATSGPRPFPGP